MTSRPWSNPRCTSRITEDAATGGHLRVACPFSAQASVVESSQQARNGGGPRAAFVPTRFCPHCPPKFRPFGGAYHVSHCTCRNCDAKQTASHGVASFYSDTETASGEKFDKNELTAAHRSLPFGTKLRVTDVSSGRFVTVRVNDRGPYIRGRVVDISPSAAEALGMVDKGITNVRLDVVQ